MKMNDLSLKGTVVRKKENITLVIDKYVLDDIRSDIKNTISLNAKVNQILQDYVMYQKVINLRHPIITFPEIFVSLLDNVDENSVIETWIRGMDEISPFLHYSLNIPESKTDTFKQSLEWGVRLGLYSCYILRERENRVILTFDHQFGLKWSKAIAAGFTKWVEKTLSVHPTSEILINTVILTIPYIRD